MDDCVTELACRAEGWNVQRWVCEREYSQPSTGLLSHVPGSILLPFLPPLLFHPSLSFPYF